MPYPRIKLPDREIIAICPPLERADQSDASEHESPVPAFPDLLTRANIENDATAFAYVRDRWHPAA